MEWVLRILMSYLAVPGPPSRTEEELRCQLLAHDAAAGGAGHAEEAGG